MAEELGTNEISLQDAEQAPHDLEAHRHEDDARRTQTVDADVASPGNSSCLRLLVDDAVFEPDSLRDERHRLEARTWDQIRIFDASSRVFIGVLTIEWVLYLLSPPLFLTFLIVVALPAEVVFLWWKKNQAHCTLNHLVHAFGLGFYLVTFAMLCASYLWLILALGVMDWMGRAGAFDGAGGRAFAFTFFVLVIIPFVASEEFFKARFVGFRKSMTREQQATRANLLHSTSVSVGYASCQALAWVTFIQLLLTANEEYRRDLFAQVVVCLLVGLSVTIAGTPLNVLSGYLVGLEATRGKPLHHAIALPVVLRSLYYITAVGWILVAGPWGLFLFLMTNVVICGLMWKRIKQVEACMPASYLRRVGYLTFDGYSLLTEDDTAPDDNEHDAPQRTDLEMVDQQDANTAGADVAGASEVTLEFSKTPL